MGVRISGEVSEWVCYAKGNPLRVFSRVRVGAQRESIATAETLFLSAAQLFLRFWSRCNLDLVSMLSTLSDSVRRCAMAMVMVMSAVMVTVMVMVMDT